MLDVRTAVGERSLISAIGLLHDAGFSSCQCCCLYVISVVISERWTQLPGRCPQSARVHPALPRSPAGAQQRRAESVSGPGIPSQQAGTGVSVRRRRRFARCRQHGWRTTAASTYRLHTARRQLTGVIDAA